MARVLESDVVLSTVNAVGVAAIFVEQIAPLVGIVHRLTERLERIESELSRLTSEISLACPRVGVLETLAARCVGQSEALTRLAEKRLETEAT